MATYTLSFTGAQVNAAIGNATNLFSTAHTWTGVQTLQAPTIAGPTITGNAYLDTVLADGDLTVSGVIYAGNIEATGNILFDGDVYCRSTLEVSSTATFTCDGSATFNDDIAINGDAAIDGDLTITGAITSSLRVTGSATFTNKIEAGQGIDNRRIISFWDGSDENFGAYMYFTHTAITSDHMDGVYIDKTGIHAFSSNDPIPANVLVIEFDY